MREKGDISGLRSRYRHQPTRRAHQGGLGSRQVLAKRPHAASPKNTVDGLTRVPVKRMSAHKPQLARPSVLTANKQIPTPALEHSHPKKVTAPKERPVQRSYVLKRETVAKPEQKQKLRLTDRLKQPQTILVIAGVVVFVFGVTVSIMGIKTNQQVGAQAVSRTAIPTDEDPDEKDLGPNAVRDYKVAPDMPRRIAIPKIGVNARTLALGVKNDNQLMAPTNIYDTGWYQQSAKPGQNGATLINGHVSGRTSPGVFKKLNKLAAGDRISVERGDGQIFNYKVIKLQSYPKDAVDMAAAITPVVAGKQGLNLITCAGDLEHGATGYSERLVVFAVRE
jgi:sortase A